MKEFEPTKAVISLHGLGFLQIKLDGGQRMHVWHPDLPKRTCRMWSQIHDHRFGFDSLVLKGMMVNDIYSVYEESEMGGCRNCGRRSCGPSRPATHIAYVHEGARTEKGNRPWIPRERLWVGEVSRQLVDAGETYHMLSRVFHISTPGGNGKAATLMTKTTEGTLGARSLCVIGVEPDVDFDRFQCPRDYMWDIVRDVFST